MERIGLVLVGLSAGITLYLLTALSGSAAPTATITVNTTADTVTSDGKCSLREAIQAANTNLAVHECAPGAIGIDSIVFNLGSGNPSIQVKSTALPTITGAVSINGNTGGATRIELNGTLAGAGAHGLTITAGKTTIHGMVINRFGGNGIEIVGGSFNILTGNFIGTNAAGTADLGNTGNGIHLNTGTNHMIGGTTAANRNIISGNQSNGIEIDNDADANATPSSNTISGNYIGTDITGTSDLGNDVRGIVMFFGSSNIIGGTTGVLLGGWCVGACNLISGNGSSGIGLGRVCKNNNIRGNFVGTDVTGTADLGNTGAGILVSEASNNFIGGTTGGSRNLVSGNGGAGVQVVVGKENTIQGNLIGTNTTGTTALGNSGAGISLDRTFANTVGGTTASARNIISGNTGDGIFMGASAMQTPSHDNLIQGNYIGVQISGIGSLGNGGDGVDVSKGTGNIIGGTTGTTPGGVCTGACNVITANTQYGIRIRDGASNTTVQGNIIGMNFNGDTAPGGNVGGGVGILDTSHDNLVGGTTANARNLISNNFEFGIEIQGEGATNNRIQGNFIGTDTTGLGTRINHGSGILIRAANNTIGGTEAGARNLISGNLESGILIQGADTTGNRVLGNYIGTNLNGTGDLGNQEYGILFSDDQPSGNQIGGSISDTSSTGANVIASNTDSAVKINGGNHNSVRFNSIFSNAAPEIDLSFGNDDQPAPVLTAATAGSTNIQGSLTAAPSTVFALDFYNTPDCAHAQGKTYIGSANVTTNGSGSAGFTTHLTFSAAIGTFVTATATDPNNNTSEFSNCLAVVQGPTSTPTRTSTHTATPTKTTTPATPTATATTGCVSKPTKPSLKAPADNAVLATNRPSLKWNALACADMFIVIVKNVATGLKADKKAGLTKLKYKTKPLATGATYKWFVKGCNNFGCSKSAARKFSIP